MANIKSIVSKEDYENFIHDGKKVVKMSAEWCFPCKMLGNVIINLDDNKLNDFTFGEIDVDEEFAEEITKDLNIKNIPVTIFFVNGKEVDRLVGAVSSEELYKKLKEC